MATVKTNDLTATQLTIVMHLCNGLLRHDIAIELHCSDTNVAKHLGIARRKLGARTLPQLVSIVIAEGRLEMNESGERVIAS